MFPNKMIPEFENSLLPWMGKTMKFCEYHFQRKFQEKSIQLTRKQMLVLKFVQHNGPLPQNDLAFLTDRDKTSLTRLINGLEKKNWVARIPSETDGRVNLIHLTKSGVDMLEVASPIVQEILAEVQNNISDEDREVVIRVMKQMQENISSLSH